MNASDLSVKYIEECLDDGEVKTFLRLTNASTSSLNTHWRLYFSLGVKPLNEVRIVRVLVEGRYGYLTPADKTEPLAAGESLTIEVETWLFSGMQLLARQGFHVVELIDGKEKLLGAPILAAPLLEPLTKPRHPMIRALSPEPVYETQPVETGTAISDHVIPAVKACSQTVETLPKDTLHFNSFNIISDDTLANEAQALASILGERRLSPEGSIIELTLDSTLVAEYELRTFDNVINIIGRRPSGVFHGIQTLRQLLRDDGSTTSIPRLQIADAPDFEHRGLFLDIARHFQSVRKIKKVIAAMAGYKMNRLILGIANDEGWRLEVPDIPELNHIGSKRSFYQLDEYGTRIALAPAWGDDHREVEGCISCVEFVSLVSYAAKHHVELIVEINLPGHANALLRSLEQSEQWQLQDPHDESSYRSAQGYTANVINVGMDDTYRLITDLLAHLRDLYQEAGAPLNNIHFGGDEVPEGAWLRSPACRALTVWDKAWSIDNPAHAAAASDALMHYHYERITKIAKAILPDTHTFFWHEMAPHGDNASTYNAWVAAKGGQHVIDKLTARRQKIVVSNASYLYLDMPYEMAAGEPGLPWANYVDARSIYYFDPIECWKIAEEDLELIVGIQAQLWTETVFTEELMDYYLFPRLLAVAERAWNRTPDLSRWPAFSMAMKLRELPFLESLGIRYRSFD
ncbi:MAG: hexosaminidase [Candidatus Azotimanducaceae bacterium]|jgi:hexosaminidase